MLSAAEKRELSVAEQYNLRIRRTTYTSSTENVRLSTLTPDDYVPGIPVSQANKTEIWVQLGINIDTVVTGKLVEKRGSFALMFFKDVPFDGLFIIVHASQLFQQKPIVESMLDSQHINNCIAASYAFQRSEHRFESMDEGYISFVAALSRLDNEPIRKRMREDELYDALVRPSQQSVVHIQGRLARLPGKQTHLCNCGDATCMKMVSGAHICEICKNGVFAVFCFAVANEHNYDGICKPCFNAGLHSVTISAEERG